MVGGQLVGALPEHLVVERVGVHFDVAANKIVHLHNHVLRHLETDGPSGGFGEQTLSLFCAERERVTQSLAGFLIVDEGLSLRLRLGAFGRQFFGSVEGIVCVACLDELLGVFAVDAAPLALAVRTVGVLPRSFFHHLAVLHSFVGGDAAPTQCFDDVLLGAGHETVGVGVFYPEHEGASVLFCVKIIIQRSAHAAYVQRAGGGRCETHPGLSVFFHRKNKDSKKLLAGPPDGGNGLEI